jgi:hypothetical protein
MTKRISHVSNLPEWFNLEKYDAARSLNAVGWYEQLSIRRELINPPYAAIRIESMLSEAPPILSDESKMLWDIICSTPILNIEGKDLLRIYPDGGALYELKIRKPRYSFGVRLTTVAEHYKTEHCIKSDMRNFARKYYCQKYGEDNDLTLPLPIQDWFEHPIDAMTNYQRYDINIRVNTLLPDKILIEQFERLLHNYRSLQLKSGLKIGNVRKPEYSDWVRFGVLPYLDLLIWQQKTGKNIPNRVMADAIYPQGDGGEEVVRKTTAKIADELLTLKHLETLAAHAAHEITERNIA